MIPGVQYVVNGLNAGATCALVALGFGLIFHVCGFFHFAHGGVYALGAYTAYALIRLVGWPIWCAVPSAILIAALAGATIDLSVYRPLRRIRATPLAILIASLGLLLVIQNGLSLVFGDDTKSLRVGDMGEAYSILGARLTAIQIMTIFTVIVVVGTLNFLFSFSGFGKKLRAVANDPELASIFGVNTKTVVTITFMFGSAIAGLAAILAAFDTDLTPVMGFKVLLGAVVAVIVGGRGSTLGVLLGGLLVGMAQHLAVWKLPAQWQDTSVFIILVVFLLFRPQGFLGKPLRKAAI
jgi:branched-chain amino acid transport system permease protein